MVDQLGAGAFGRALLCRDKSTREFVVIKENKVRGQGMRGTKLDGKRNS